MLISVTDTISRSSFTQLRLWNIYIAIGHWTIIKLSRPWYSRPRPSWNLDILDIQHHFIFTHITEYKFYRVRCLLYFTQRAGAGHRDSGRREPPPPSLWRTSCRRVCTAWHCPGSAADFSSLGRGLWRVLTGLQGSSCRLLKCVTH